MLAKTLAVAVVNFAAAGVVAPIIALLIEALVIAPPEIATLFEA